MPAPAAAARRWRSIDAVRGFGLMAMIVLHGALYHYGALARIDFDHPPPVVVVIGFLLMWGGLFAVLSGAVHATRALEQRACGVGLGAWCRREWIGSAGYLLLGVAYFALVGPGLLNLSDGSQDSSVLVGFLRSGQWRAPSAARWLYMNTLFMIGFATLFATPVVAALLAAHGPGGPVLQRAAAAVALVALLSSALRIPLYPLYERAAAEGRPLWLLAGFWLVNKNDPIWPSLGLVLGGTLLGFAMNAAPQPGRLRWPVGLGLLLLVAGTGGWLLGAPSMLRRSVDQTWLSIMLLQAGVILLGLCGLHRALDAPAGSAGGAARPGAFGRVLERFSRMSLSVLFGETVLAEAAARGLASVRPDWNSTVPAVLLFGCANAAAWALLLARWERGGYAFSLERGWVRVMAALGRPSTRLVGWPAPSP